MCGNPVECVTVSQWNESQYLKNESRYMHVYWYARMSRIASHGTHVCGRFRGRKRALQRVAACCSVMQCDAVRCSAMQCVAVCCTCVLAISRAEETPSTRIPAHMNKWSHIYKRVTAHMCVGDFEGARECCSVLQCVAVCCSPPPPEQLLIWTSQVTYLPPKNGLIALRSATNGRVSTF